MPAFSMTKTTATRVYSPQFRFQNVCRLLCIGACVLLLSACSPSSNTGVISSASSEDEGDLQSFAQSNADLAMSGEYYVGADGKLLSPVNLEDIEPPVRSWASQKYDKEGAEAFARYVVELFPYTWMSGDTTEFESISHPECEWCQNILIKPVRERAANGGWIAEVSYTVNSLGPAFQIPAHEGIWNVDLDLTRSAFMGYDGVELIPAEEYHEKVMLQLQFLSGEWKLWAGGAQ